MKTFTMDIIDNIINILKLNKKNIYKEFVLQCSLSQLIRGKTHSQKKSIKLFKKSRKILISFHKNYLV